MASIKEKLAKLAGSKSRIGATAGIVSLVSGMSLVTSSLNETQASEIVTGHAVKTNEEVNTAARIIDIDRSKLVHKNYLRAVEVLDAYTDKTSNELKFDPSMFDGKEYTAPAAAPKGSTKLNDKNSNEVKAEETTTGVTDNHELSDIEKNIDSSKPVNTDDISDSSGSEFDESELNNFIGNNVDIGQVRSAASVTGLNPASSKEAARAVNGMNYGSDIINALTEAESKSSYVDIDDRNLDEDCAFDDSVVSSKVKADSVESEINKSSSVSDAKLVGETVNGTVTFELDIYYGRQIPSDLQQSGLKVVKSSTGVRDSDGSIEWNEVQLTDDDIISVATGNEKFDRSYIKDVGLRSFKPTSASETVNVKVLTGYDRNKASAQNEKSQDSQSNDDTQTQRPTQDHTSESSQTADSPANSPQPADGGQSTASNDNESTSSFVADQNGAQSQPESKENETTSATESTNTTDDLSSSEVKVAQSVIDVHFIDKDSDTGEELSTFTEKVEYSSNDELIKKIESIIDSKDINESYKVIDSKMSVNFVTRIIKRIVAQDSTQTTDSSNSDDQQSKTSNVGSIDVTPQLVKTVADSKLATIQSLSNRAEYSKYTSFNDFDASLLDKRTISDLVFSISNGSYNSYDSSRVLQPSQHVVKLLELNKRFEDRLLYRLNDFRRSLGLPEFTSQPMTLEQDRMFASHAIYNYLAANHSSSGIDSMMMSQLNLIQSETMQPAHHLKTIGQYLTPEAAADSLYRAILSEASSYANGDGGQTGHLKQLLDPDNRTISAALFIGDYTYWSKPKMSDYTISTTLQYYKD